MNKMRLKTIKNEATNIPVADIPEKFAGLIQLNTSASGKIRNRIFTITKTFWMFLYQILNQNCSCDAAVIAAVSSSFIGEGIYGNSSYCKARQRIMESFLMKILSGLINILNDKFEKKTYGAEES